MRLLIPTLLVTLSLALAADLAWHPAKVLTVTESESVTENVSYSHSLPNPQYTPPATSITKDHVTTRTYTFADSGGKTYIARLEGRRIKALHPGSQVLIAA